MNEILIYCGNPILLCDCCGCCGDGDGTYTGDCTCFVETRDDDAAVAKSTATFLFGKTD